jgi:hypothetical protein
VTVLPALCAGSCREFRALSACRRFATVSASVGIHMPQEIQGVVWLLAVMTALALLVKYERRVKRWCLKTPRRRRPAYSRRPVLF